MVHTSFHGGSSHPVTPGAVYRGSVKKVKADGKLIVTIPRLGHQHFYNCDALRGPENNPYLVDDQVLCVFLNNELSELFILGRFNYKIDVNNPEFNPEDITLWNQITRHATTYRHTGINIHDPQFPLHVGGQTRERGVTIKIEPTEHPSSYRAGIALDRTELVSAGNIASRGDFGVWDRHTAGWTLYHSGYWGTDGGHTGNTGDSYLIIGGASGGDGRTTPAGDQTRNIYIYPTTGGSHTEYNAITWSGADDGGYSYISLGSPTYFKGNVAPVDWAGNYDLGTTGYRWQDIYLKNQPNVSSDETLKTDIVDSDLGLDFINGLRPVSFKWIARDDGGPGVRKHYGFIAQEVQTLLGDSASNTAFWTEETVGAVAAEPEKLYPDGEVRMPARLAVEEHTVQGLRYDELMAPIIKAIQEVDNRVEGLGAANVEAALNLAQQAIDYCQSFDAAYLAKQPMFEEREALLDDIVTRVEALEG